MSFNRFQRGFSLFELMIVVAVVAILLAVALPAYTNYSVRARVSECINLASAARMAVNDRVLRGGSAPSSSSQAGFDFGGTEFCGDIRIADGGTVVVETKNTGAPEDPVIQFTLDLDTAIASVDWDCEYVSGDPAHVPSNCRSLGTAATGGTDSGYDGGTGTGGTGGSGTGGSGTGGSGTGGSGTGRSHSGGTHSGGHRTRRKLAGASGSGGEDSGG
ncbi:MAG: pilin, partial [Candidatus Wenzhouxiangella sp. M2_3B_020]